MSKKIKVTSKTLKRLNVSSPTLPKVEPAKLSAALGAESGQEAEMKQQGPLSLLALRQEVSNRLMSTGGRPSLEGTSRRQKIPMADEDWDQLCELAELLGDDETKPTPGQVASILLHQALNNVSQLLEQTKLRAKLKSERANR